MATYTPQSVVSATVSNFTASGTYGNVLDFNSDRKVFYAQNIGTGGSLNLKLGTGASSSSFSVILKADSAVNAGQGGSYTDSTWKGPVSITGNSFANSYIVWETT